MIRVLFRRLRPWHPSWTELLRGSDGVTLNQEEPQPDVEVAAAPNQSLEDPLPPPSATYRTSRGFSSGACRQMERLWQDRVVPCPLPLRCFRGQRVPGLAGAELRSSRRLLNAQNDAMPTRAPATPRPKEATYPPVSS